jgi:glutathione S-transferase
MEREYIVYGGPISLFTRKLEAALRFYGTPFRMEAKNDENREELEGRSRSHQVPVLRTPENWLIADTTPILGLLDARFPARQLVPPGPLGVLVHVIEEVLDEWIARVMVHYRWHYEENTRYVIGRILGRELSADEARDFPLAKWGPRACRATGTESEHQQRAAEREYFELLGALEAQLMHTRYALGDRPTAVDSMLLGGLRAHTNSDPLPDLRKFAHVLAWDEKEADRWDGSGTLAPFPDSTPFAQHVLELARQQYAPFVLGNARALAAGDKAFTIETYGEETSYLTRPYPEQSRSLIRERIRNQLDDADRAIVVDWLAATGLAECFS